MDLAKSRADKFARILFAIGAAAVLIRFYLVYVDAVPRFAFSGPFFS
jgi:hypothetical protein